MPTGPKFDSIYQFYMQGKYGIENREYHQFTLQQERASFKAIIHGYGFCSADSAYHGSQVLWAMSHRERTGMGMVIKGETRGGSQVLCKITAHQVVADPDRAKHVRDLVEQLAAREGLKLKWRRNIGMHQDRRPVVYWPWKNAPPRSAARLVSKLGLLDKPLTKKGTGGAIGHGVIGFTSNTTWTRQAGSTRLVQDNVLQTMRRLGL